MYRIHRAVHWASLDAYIRSLGPAAWFRMDQGVTVTGAGISQVDDLSGNARHLLDPGTTRPIYLPYSGTRYLYLPGVAGNYASTPDSVANSITGDIDIRVRVALDDWTPATINALVAKWASAANFAFRFFISAASGAPVFRWTVDGSTQIIATATASPTVADGGRIWMRVTLDVDNGAAGKDVKFYTAADSATEPTNWTQLGSTVTSAGTTSIFDSTGVIEVGSDTLGAGNFSAGKIYRAIIKNGIDGTTVVDFNAADASDGATSFASSATGETWTINRSGSLPAYIVGMAGAMGNGSSHYLRASFTSDQPITDYLVCRPLSWTLNDQIIGGVSANAGVIFQAGSAPSVSIFDGSAAAANTNLAVDSRAVVCAVHNGANGVLRVNNTTETTGNSGSGNPGGITLMASNIAGGFTNAIAYELVRFHAAHDLATRARIVAGLMARHGVAG